VEEEISYRREIMRRELEGTSSSKDGYQDTHELARAQRLRTERAAEALGVATAGVPDSKGEEVRDESRRRRRRRSSSVSSGESFEKTKKASRKSRFPVESRR